MTDTTEPADAGETIRMLRARVAELESAMLAITKIRVNPEMPRGLALFKVARKIAVAAMKGETP
mgnify:FL=1